MIGGEDFVIPTKAGAVALQRAVSQTTLFWPQAVFEDAESGERFDQESSIPFGKCREILAYKDQTLAARWDQLGADDSLVETMIHLLVSDKSLTIVVDADPSEQMKDFVKEVRENVLWNLSCIPTPVAAWQP